MRDITVLGRVIGQSDCWDAVDDFALVCYDFEPKDGVALLCGDLTIDFTTGWFSYNDEQYTFDMMDILNGIDRPPVKSRDTDVV